LCIKLSGSLNFLECPEVMVNTSSKLKNYTLIHQLFSFYVALNHKFVDTDGTHKNTLTSTVHNLTAYINIPQCHLQLLVDQQVNFVMGKRMRSKSNFDGISE